MAATCRKENRILLIACRQRERESEGGREGRREGGGGRREGGGQGGAGRGGREGGSSALSNCYIPTNIFSMEREILHRDTPGTFLFINFNSKYFNFSPGNAISFEIVNFHPKNTFSFMFSEGFFQMMISRFVIISYYFLFIFPYVFVFLNFGVFFPCYFFNLFFVFFHFFLQTFSFFFSKCFFCGMCSVFCCFFPLLKEKEFVLECVDCFFSDVFLICLAFLFFEHFSVFFKDSNF